MQVRVLPFGQPFKREGDEEITSNKVSASSGTSLGLMASSGSPERRAIFENAMNCLFPNCRSNAVSGEYCIGHAKMMGVSKEKKANPIPKRSESMKEKVKDLKKIVAQFLKKPGNQFCAIQSPVCTKIATCVNHKAGRTGEKLTDERYFEASCVPCNNYIEQHDAWARKRGHKLKRID